MFNVSDTAYDNFMGRYSVRLAPVFADFAGIEAGQRVARRRRGHRRADAGARAPRRGRRRRRPVAAVRRGAERRFPGIDVKAAPAEELPWPDESFDAALAQLVVTFMNDAPAGVAEMRRVVRPGGVVAVCMWDRDRMEMLAAVHRTQATVSVRAGPTEARTLYRTREEIEGLFAGRIRRRRDRAARGRGRVRRLRRAWSTLVDGAGPAGVWVKSLDDEQLAAAREELHRQVGEPAGAFTLRGRAWATRATRA